MEGKIIEKYSIHNHPLVLKERNIKWWVKSCYVCNEIIPDLEMAYFCTKPFTYTCYYFILHKECGELPLPSEMRHIKHPLHPIRIFDFHERGKDIHNDCDECGDLVGVGYRCHICDFNIDLKCLKAGMEVLVEERKELEHPSHPHHPLTLMRKPPFSFPCDGCGVNDVDMAYVCSTYDFWVHKSCASLPLLHECHHHHHPLSLAFSFPEKHRKFKYKCEVCYKPLGRTYWVYFCGDCRYFVHIKCMEVGSSSSSTRIQDCSHNLNEDVIEFPLHENDISNKLITPFVMTQTGLDHIPEAVGTSNSRFVCKYHHEHPLRLVSEFTHKAEVQYEEEDKDEDEKTKICDVCITPIPSSTLYYKCAADDACTYSIHSICSSLPHTLQYPSSSTSHLLKLYGDDCCISKNHNFTLSTLKDFVILDCNLCSIGTNGMGYECGDCRKKMDVKCASLPTTIRHAFHKSRHHEPLTLTRVTSASKEKKCHVCDESFEVDDIGYCCSHDGCDFALDIKCAQLPSSLTNREWDKHPLLLTCDASRDHPSDFYCELCEEEMHPKEWMYHCRQCDASFHLKCLDTYSGYLRNCKLGQPYKMDRIHPSHPLILTWITLKKHCDRCLKDVYTYIGFECESCYYAVCAVCGLQEL